MAVLNSLQASIPPAISINCWSGDTCSRRPSRTESCGADFSDLTTCEAAKSPTQPDDMKECWFLDRCDSYMTANASCEQDDFDSIDICKRQLSYRPLRTCYSHDNCAEYTFEGATCIPGGFDSQYACLSSRTTSRTQGTGTLKGASAVALILTDTSLIMF